MPGAKIDSRAAISFRTASAITFSAIPFKMPRPVHSTGISAAVRQRNRTIIKRALSALDARDGWAGLPYHCAWRKSRREGERFIVHVKAANGPRAEAILRGLQADGTLTVGVKLVVNASRGPAPAPAPAPAAVEDDSESDESDDDDDWLDQALSREVAAAYFRPSPGVVERRPVTQHLLNTMFQRLSHMQNAGGATATVAHWILTGEGSAPAGGGGAPPAAGGAGEDPV